ncbi:TIGR03808 family TAT-translocated repetitive protein [Bosea sp. (in: a-proteobacteria)]|uniref:TIGR03808 family TAT-translocated repetitive protein n=1 Tax=Bosea sp. (in: a-proteobacteria) TaxID=1871050 RepID=UPI002DDC8FA8|nr:TIGR03808 family TAT-translocated repetitive protein [Bosea sp. (in: a-proteobacteria)]HEV2513416.1 TIGR03808 family TAT-translocated repetitive protein [Bosea sp. (in: a-proteobacteria)]
MTLSRRDWLRTALFGTVAASAGPVLAQAPRASAPASLGTLGLEAAQFGLRPGSAEDQSRALQAALVEAVKRAAPLIIAPGRYRIANVVLPENARLIGVPGATQFIAAQAGPMLVARRIKRAAIAGIMLDGLDIKLGQRSGLLNAEEVLDLALSDCEFANAGSVGLTLSRTAGRIERNRFRSMRDSALFSLDSRGLSIEANTVEDCGNNGIQLWRSQAGDDQSLIRGNRLNRIRSDAGGDGPNGNGISLFRAGGVVIEGNTLRDCALTFIRNNSGSNVQILGNQGRRCGETALYSEFAFEGAIIANNLIEDCAQGASVTNLDHGGRLAVVANNIIRNAQKGLAPKGKEPVGGSGLHVEAEAAVTGNVIENASDVGITLGWSWAMRNLVATSNVVRRTGIGISVSLVPKERNALIANNVISEAKLGAVVGTEFGKVVTGDLTKGEDKRAAGIRVEGNSVG